MITNLESALLRFLETQVDEGPTALITALSFVTASVMATEMNGDKDTVNFLVRRFGIAFQDAHKLNS